MNSNNNSEDTAKLQIKRHSLSHILAAAVKSLYPEVKFGIGPAIENGFYYDFDLSCSLTPETLPDIEAKMREIMAKGLPFKKEIISREEARKLFADQPYKLELIDELNDGDITIYRSGETWQNMLRRHVGEGIRIPKPCSQGFLIGEFERRLFEPWVCLRWRCGIAKCVPLHWLEIGLAKNHFTMAGRKGYCCSARN